MIAVIVCCFVLMCVVGIILLIRSLINAIELIDDIDLSDLNGENNHESRS